MSSSSITSRLTRYSISAVALACLAACAVGPDYRKPDITMPDHWQTDPAIAYFQPAQPNDAALKGDWWEMFGDQQLTSLMHQALEHNPSLTMAAEHLNQARLQVTVVGSAQMPQLALQASDARFKIAADRPLGAYNIANTSTVQNNPQLGFVVNYEADLFGRVRRLVESTKAAQQQAEADFGNARLVLLSELAANYFNLVELDAEIRLMQKSVDFQKKALNFIQIRHDLDVASGLDLAQQQALLDTNITQVSLLQNQRAAVKNAIATLTGHSAPEFDVATPSTSLTVPSFPLGLPAEILQRRPDIASAERAMAQANATIGVARAAYYPSIMLQANGGWDSNQFANLFNAPSILWSLGASATQNLVDGGKIAATVNIAESSYVAAVANYRRSVLVAMQEVQTGIDSMALLAAAHTQAEAAVRSADRVLELANDRYSGGLDIYLNVISAQQALLSSQRQVTQIHGQQMLNSVYLIKALGGGWVNGSPTAVVPKRSIQ